MLVNFRQQIKNHIHSYQYRYQMAHHRREYALKVGYLSPELNVTVMVADYDEWFRQPPLFPLSKNT